MADELRGNRPRRQTDLTAREIRQALNSQADAWITLRDLIHEDMKPKLEAVYHEMYGTEGQGGVLRDIDQLKRDRGERRKERQQDLVLWVMAAGVIASIIVPLLR